MTGSSRYRATLPGLWMIGGAGVGVAIVCALMFRAGLVIDFTARSMIPFYVSGALALALCTGFRNGETRRQRLLRDLAEYLALGMLIAVAGALASYPAAAQTRGFIDPTLMRADAMLGLDWLAWYRLVAAHPSLQVAGRIAYDAIFWMPGLLLAAFAWDERRDRARALLATLAVAAAITLMLFRLAPAVGPLAYMWHGPLPYLPESALWQPQLIPPLREHLIRVVDLGELRGLVSFPSFHTAAGVIFIVAGWPVRRLRWPVTAVNAAMLLATPVEGTHYFVDMIAGALVALGSIWIVSRLHVWLAMRSERVRLSGAVPA